MIKYAALLVLISIAFGPVAAQDTLPEFTVTTQGKGRNIISWTNTYPKITQISIQRSQDSLRNFRTILSVPDPTVPQNGFVDTKAPTSFSFYRIFIVLDSGKYIFSESKRPFWDTVKKIAPPPPDKNGLNGKRVIISDSITSNESERIRDRLNEKNPDTEIKKPEPEKIFIVKRRDSIVAEISEKKIKAFRDSVVYKTKDTLLFRSRDTILIKPFVPKEVYRPSKFVFTEKDGNVAIALPEAATKHYSIKFFDEKENPLFEIQRVKEASLVLDKANFLHAGWFRFELYEDGKLKERHKFYIPKDF